MNGLGARFEAQEGVGRITLVWPHVSNAIDTATAQELGDCVTHASSEQFRAVLVEGEGRRFCGE
ncbi:hypothetical protein NPS01_17350 [Nocardioides psychrotolerans]|nr:hypothetical protein NPS01_17350 [Nocardioides psychrotolerans]